MLEAIAEGFRPRCGDIDEWSLRLVERCDQAVTVRRDVLQPLHIRRSVGACVTVSAAGGVGYGSTADITPAGLQEAVSHARDWAVRNAQAGLVPASSYPWPQTSGEFVTLEAEPWDAQSLPAVIDHLVRLGPCLHSHADIVHWEAQLAHRRSRTVLVSSAGGRISQRVSYLSPGLLVVGSAGEVTQTRSFGADYVRQGGLEQLALIDFDGAAARLGEQVIQLLHAPECPAGVMDVLLMPSQMVLQIHESIGHPLELDRILGDERNYAGGSFVTREMFGHYQYGSQLLNVTFDPTVPNQLADYRFDDEGTAAKREYLIRDGILQRALGGAGSELRAGIPGVACARADDWNRPAIDRMANLNLEPGSSSFDDLLAGIERGILMDTNRSWSIDDLRNKFQFGCEYGRLIEDGRLGAVVRNPGYRGVSANFWRNLARVGNADLFQVMGLASCGKGEPNQIMQVGHASPPCVFKGVEVFGGG
jgi:predicted Zn-dependent protease